MPAFSVTNLCTRSRSMSRSRSSRFKTILPKGVRAARSCRGDVSIFSGGRNASGEPSPTGPFSAELPPSERPARNAGSAPVSGRFTAEAHRFRACTAGCRRGAILSSRRRPASARHCAAQACTSVLRQSSKPWGMQMGTSFPFTTVASGQCRQWRTRPPGPTVGPC